jgi:hypothetical protein
MHHITQSAVRATSLAAAIVACLTSVSAHAANTAQMQDIKLYGEVTIAQDSVQSWGPWEQFEAPAAGNRLPMPTFGSDASNLYRPISPIINPNPVPPTPLPETTLTGFGTFVQYYDSEGVYVRTTPDQALVTASIAGTTTSIGLPTSVSAVFDPHTALGTTGLPLDSTGQLNITDRGYGSPDGRITVTPVNVPDIDPNAIQAWPYLLQYISGVEMVQAEASSSDYFSNAQFGVVGVQTSATDMAALRSGNFSATYVGKTLAVNYDFNMKVNFGAGTFTASAANPDASAKVKINFSGVVNGANVTSTKVVAGGSTNAQGGLNGFFTGKQAVGFIGNIKVVPGDGMPGQYALSDTVVAKQTSLVQASAPK